MEALFEGTCDVCKVGAPTATADEQAAYLREIPDWGVVERDRVARLERVFLFKNFAEALDFTDRVGALAEEAGHHPVLVTEWGRVTVTWWTHKIGGLHRNDFIMAAKTDKLEEGP